MKLIKIEQPTDLRPAMTEHALSRLEALIRLKESGQISEFSKEWLTGLRSIMAERAILFGHLEDSTKRGKVKQVSADEWPED